MRRFVLALDQGTTSSRSILFDHDGNAVAIGAARIHAALSALRAGSSTTPRRSGPRRPRRSREVLARARRDRRRRRGHRHHEPARDDGALGSRAPGGRSPAPSSGRTGARRTPARALKAEGHEPSRAAHRPAARPLFLGHQARLAARQRSRAARARAERGELAFGTVDSWLVWKLTRRRAHVTDAINASRTLLSTSRPATGTTTLLDLLGIPRAVLPRVVPSSMPAGTAASRCSPASTSRSPASRATSRRRCSARPASRRAWPRTPTAPAASC